MSRQSDQLDRYVEALNTGAPLPSADDDADLRSLFGTVQLIHDVAGREWPDSDFSSRLAESLSSRLQVKPEVALSNGAHPLPMGDVAPPILQPYPHEVVRPDPVRHPWYREGLRLVAGLLVVAAVGALLVATFGGHLFGDGSPVPASQPNAPRSIFDTDPDLRQAHQAGWGREVDQTRSARGYRITLHWVGSDSKWIFVTFEIAGPQQGTYASITPGTVTLTLPDGTLNTMGMSGCSLIDGTYQCVYKYTRPASLNHVTSTVLNIEVPALRVTPLSTVSGDAIPQSTVVTGDSRPRATPTAPPPGAYIPGPFKFTVLLPLHTVTTTATPVEPLTPVAIPSIFDTDPDLRRAYVSHWGKGVNQTRTASNATVTLRWAGSDTNWIFLVIDIATPANGSNGKVISAAAVVTLPDGTKLARSTGSCSRVEVNSVYSCVMKYLRPDTLKDTSSVTLNVQIPGLSTAEATPPSQPVDVQGPFTYSVSLPLYSPNLPAPTPLNVNGPLPSRAYVVANGFVDVLDAGTGNLLHQLPLDLGTPSPFIAVDAVGDRLFVTDSGQDGDLLSVFRTTDWSVERQVPVPNIIRYLEPTTSGIASSKDGHYVYVYNYNDRTRGSDPVTYWLATYDVQAGKWLDKTANLPSCGVSRLLPGASGLVYVRCHDTGDLRVVDPVNGTVIRGIASSESLAVDGENVYSVSSDGTVHVLNAVTGSDHVLDHASASSLDLMVPAQPIGIAPDGRELFVPTGTADEVKQGLAHAFAVTDTQTGTVARMVQVSQPFRWVAFAPDGSAAFLEIGDSSGSDQFLERIDLETGAEQTILQAPLSPQMVIAP